MAAPKILVVDDEKNITEILKSYLEREKYIVLTAHDGPEALYLAGLEKPDLIILDLMLPGFSGEEVSKKLRGDDSRVPIIMLTAKTALEDKIYGLGVGADDYVVKPFSPQEVVARVKSMLRRNDPDQISLTDVLVLAGGDLEIDTPAHRITWQKRELNLTPTEFNLLLYLAKHPGRVFSRAQLAETIFGYDSIAEDRAVDAHIKNLRQKMHKEGIPQLIKTIYGVGYKYEED